MVRSRVQIGIALLVALAGGCSILGLGGVEDDLRDRRGRWEALGITDYTYDIVWSCFCGYPAGRPLRVAVRGDTVVSLTEVGTGQPPQDAPPAWLGTIDEVFAHLLDEARRGADDMDVDFHADYYFPTRATIDRIKNAIDDEEELSLSNFLPRR